MIDVPAVRMVLASLGRWHGYAYGGGLTTEGRTVGKMRGLSRAAVRAGHEPLRISSIVRLNTESAYQWRRAFWTGADAALASRGLGGYGCKLDERQLGGCARAVCRPAAYGGDTDQQRTLAPVTVLIGRQCRVPYTLRGTSYLLHRLGFVHPVDRRAPGR